MRSVWRAVKEWLPLLFFVAVLAGAGYAVWKFVPWAGNPAATTTTTPTADSEVYCRGVVDGQGLSIAYTTGRNEFFAQKDAGVPADQADMLAVEAAKKAQAEYDAYVAEVGIEAACNGVLSFAINRGLHIYGPVDRPGGGGDPPTNS